MLGLIWQLIRAHLLTNVNLTTHPELIRLLGPKESLTTLISVPSETILLRWFNYHLTRAGLGRKIQNFSKDVQDSELYITLLRQIAPADKRSKVNEVLDKARALPTETVEQRERRAEIVLDAAELLDSREFATARDIANGSARLNLAFAATIFNNNIGIHLPSEDESRELVEKCRAQERKISELEATLKIEVANSTSKDKKITELESTLKVQESANSSLTTNKEEAVATLAAERAENESLKKEREEQDLRIQDLTKAVAEFAEQVQEDQRKIAATDGMYQAYRQTVAGELNAIRGLLRDRFGEAGNGDGSNGDLANQDANDVSAKLKSLIKELLDENKGQKSSLAVLQGKLEKEHTVNEIIGEKIKEYAEDIITNGKRNSKSSGGWKAFLGLTSKPKETEVSAKLDKSKSQSADQIRKSSVI
ncbi:phospholipid scramblase 1 [Gonapodya sp. JEL0774]|nr:phospholipid scramblase 1 [Gonapodya sp. JEL0774]